MSVPETVQLQIIPDEPIETEFARIRVSSIPVSETHGSRQPSPSFKQSVARFGVLSPIWVAPLTEADAEKAKGNPTEARYALLAGCRRVLAAREASIMFISAVIFPFGTSSRQALSLMENAQRSENPLVELQHMEELIAKGASLDDICEAVGLDRRRAECRMRLANLIPELRQALMDNNIAVGVAEEAARLTHEQQKRAYDAAKERDGKIRGADISGVRQAAAAGAAHALPGALFIMGAGYAPLNEERASDAILNGAGGLVAVGNRQPVPSVQPVPNVPIVADGIVIRDWRHALKVSRALLEYARENAPKELPVGAVNLFRYLEGGTRAISYITHPGTDEGAEDEAAGVSPSLETELPGAVEGASLIIGASGKPISAASARKAAYRQRQKEAAQNGATE